MEQLPPASTKTDPDPASTATYILGLPPEPGPMIAVNGETIGRLLSFEINQTYHTGPLPQVPVRPIDASGEIPGIWFGEADWLLGAPPRAPDHAAADREVTLGSFLAIVWLYALAIVAVGFVVSQAR